MTSLELHTPETAPGNAGPVLAAVADQFGFTPNLFRALGNTPAVLDGFLALLQAFGKTSLSPARQQIVQLAVSVENQCAYCVAGHSAFAEAVGPDRETVAALRRGALLDDAKDQALAEFCRVLVTYRGRPDEVACERFLAAGFTQAQMLEVILGVAVKTISNYAYGVFGFPLDAQFAAHAWPEGAVRGVA
jgi:uncharacterized peroxidase-related enzyme